MKRIGLLSDTHGFLHPNVLHHFKDCDEIWHVGDIGSPAVLDALEACKTVRAVWGNIDGQDIRFRTSRALHFECEGMRVMMTHIGGRPQKYAPHIPQELLAYRPQLFICGHSHLLKVQYDPTYQMLYVNPGAAGRYGAQLVSTLIRFEIDQQKIDNLEVIELARG